MQSLSLILKSKGDEGAALPPVISALDRAGAKFRRGQLSLIAAAPGGGKSALASHISLNMAYDEFTGVPTLYFSADSDRLTIGSRIVMGVVGVEQEVAEHLVGTHDPETFEVFEAATDHIWWSFQSSPTIEDISKEVMAYAHVLGDWPHLIVVDNLMDINGDGEEYSRWTNTILNLTDLARMTQAHIMLLHHVVGTYTDGNMPVPRSGLKQKVDAKPRLILTLFQPTEGVMGVCIVKNTNGIARGDGSLRIDIPWDKSRSYFGGTDGR